MTFDHTKPYTYRDGTPARIVCTDAPGEYPIISVEVNGDVNTHIATGFLWREDDESPQDLINTPIKKTIYVNIYPPNGVSGHLTPTAAQEAAAISAIAVALPVTYEEGYGL